MIQEGATAQRIPLPGKGVGVAEKQVWGNGKQVGVAEKQVQGVQNM